LATKPSDVEHHVICLGGREWYSSHLEEAGIPLDHLNISDPLSILPGLIRLRRLVRGIDPDVVQTWMYRANVLGGAAAAIEGLPVVWGIHHSTLDVLSLPSRILARSGGVLARWIPDFVISCSRRSAEIHAELGYSAAPGAVIHNGYDPRVFSVNDKGRSATREALGISPDTFLIGSIGRWHPQKDIPNLLRALAIVSSRGRPVRSLLIGRGLGDEDYELAAAANEAACKTLVVPLGRRVDIPDLARAMDLHVLASRGGEAFPNVVAETMLSGTPNVVTDVGDAALIVGDTGWVVPPHNPEVLAGAIEAAWREWSSCPASSWGQRRMRARERIVQNFTFDKMVAAYGEIWRRLEMSRGSSTRRSERARTQDHR
jgi:glycosyltransferase involved in cell wall biosynthesis